MTLAINRLALSRGDQQVLNDINLEVEAGSAVILRGPNGSGKTTLLRAIAGFTPVQQGEIVLKSASAQIVPNARSEHIAYIGHQNGLHPALTSAENLAFWAELYSGSSSRIARATAALRVDDLTAKPVGILSAGQQRRLALCRVLIANKPIWLLDEPTASLDKAAQDQVCALIDHHCAAGGIALVASHDGLAIPGARSVRLERRRRDDA